MNVTDKIKSWLSGDGSRVKVPTMLQMEATECGAAALGMVLAHYGLWIPLEKLRQECGVNRDGSKASCILRAARRRNCKADGYRWTADDLLELVPEGAEFHIERPDGRGYPKGLKGEDIPLYARIIGVADAFDAMTANRVYRKQMDFGYVLGELEKGRGTQFDARFVDILLKLIRDGVIDLNTLYGLPPEKTGQEGAEEKKADA